MIWRGGLDGDAFVALCCLVVGSIAVLVGLSLSLVACLAS